ncbi:MAG: hypothetical protein JWN86_2808 [Planctomycetota bacterium]|nr:hypothetical protein [Planctomycetota bacterium]
MSTTLCIALLVSQVAVGSGGHRESQVGCCDSCGVENLTLTRDITTLQVAPRWRDRDNAAHRLAKFDWKCHPEIVHALVAAMLRDCNDEVREEAAESLKKLAPCLPEVHEALSHTARNDKDLCTRIQARKALRALGKNCEGSCSACDPSIAQFGSTPGEPILFQRRGATLSVPDSLGPGEAVPGIPYIPPSDLPAPLPGSSPFEPGLDSSKTDKDTALAGANKAPKRTERTLLIGRRSRSGAGR